MSAADISAYRLAKTFGLRVVERDKEHNEVLLPRSGTSAVICGFQSDPSFENVLTVGRQLVRHFRDAGVDCTGTIERQIVHHETATIYASTEMTVQPQRAGWSPGGVYIILRPVISSDQRLVEGIHAAVSMLNPPKFRP